MGANVPPGLSTCPALHYQPSCSAEYALAQCKSEGLTAQCIIHQNISPKDTLFEDSLDIP